MRLIRKIAFALWVLSFVIIGATLCYWYLDDEIPYQYDASDSYISPDPVDQGGTVTADWKIDIRRVCPATSTRVLRDPDTGKLLSTYDAVPAATSVKTTDERLQRTFTLPTRLPSRVAYSSEICFSCNPLQYFYPICTRTPELIFHVRQEPYREGRLRRSPK